MLFILYPNSKFDSDQNLLKFESKTNKIEGDWGILLPYFKLHTTRNPRLGGNAFFKCWYSENEPVGKSVKDVDHYRPANASTFLKDDKARRVEKELKSRIPQQELEDPGYSWLEFEPKNYRFSSSHCNRNGSKGWIFPILKGTQRLNTGNKPWENSCPLEYPLLLDPCQVTDCGLLKVRSDGIIFSVFEMSIKPTNFDSDPKFYWSSDWIKWVRSLVSIQILALDHQDLNEKRADTYLQVKNKLNGLLRSNQRSEMVGLMKDIFLLSAVSEPFALAARSAILDFSAPGTPNRSTIDKVKHIKKLIISKIQKHEDPSSTFPI